MAINIIDYITSVASLLASHKRIIDEDESPSPAQVFELVLKALYVANQTNNIHVVAKSAFDWLNVKWAFIWEQQRFLLRSPALHEKNIAQALLAEGDRWIDKVLDLLQAILPTMGFGNESELRGILNDIRETNS